VLIWDTGGGWTRCVLCVVCCLFLENALDDEGDGII